MLSLTAKTKKSKTKKSKRASKQAYFGIRFSDELLAGAFLERLEGHAFLIDSLSGNIFTS